MSSATSLLGPAPQKSHLEEKSYQQLEDDADDLAGERSPSPEVARGFADPEPDGITFLTDVQ